MKAVILTRVSSKEQEEGHSLSAQNTRLIEYAKRKGLDVIKSFEIVESSTRGDRKKFNAVIQFCEKQKEKVALIADSVDRIQRSFKEQFRLNELVNKGMIELHFCREGLVIHKDARATDIMMWDFAIMGAKSYILQLSENVRRSLDYKVKHGEWAGLAPIGYQNYRNEENKSCIRPHPVMAEKVRQLFEIYSLGKTSIRELGRKARAMDLLTYKEKPVSNSVIQNMLKNPFYYGEMRSKGDLVRHVYEPLISREMWERCQDVMAGNAAKAFKYSSLDYLYRGLIRCKHSGKICSTDTKKGKFVYVICFDENGKRMYIPQQEIDNQIEMILKSLQMPEGLLVALKEKLRSTKEAEVAFHKNEVASLKASLTKTNDRLDRLMDLYLDSKIDEEDYKTKRTQLHDERHNLESKIKAHEAGNDKFDETLFELCELASNAWKIYSLSKNTDQKRMFLKFVLRTLELDKGNLGYTLQKPFDMLQNLDTVQNGWAVISNLRTTHRAEIILLEEQLRAMQALKKLAA